MKNTHEDLLLIQKISSKIIVNKVRDSLGGLNGFAAKVADKAQNADLASVGSGWNWTDGDDYFPGNILIIISRAQANDNG
jgi:hypothetical protein